MSNSAQTFLCFDFGLKRFGVAVGNTLLQTGKELEPIKAKDGIPNWDIISRYIEEWQPNGFVVGLPLNMDGTENDMCLKAKKFGNRLKGRFNKPVEMMDERLSSYEAKGHVIEQQGIRDFGSHSVDGAAACLILESWFAQNN